MAWGCAWAGGVGSGFGLGFLLWFLAVDGEGCFFGLGLFLL